ncbi:IPT/TIG domain-containing protein [Pedobacter sp. B4-66]|uniref:IPT/TIG domain-containing protein n=1 Tax=Pedobacter sp. B4-66 TaxID=2817280 RepID=UPI001BDB00E0|nr:IPT/TIG domain-containing protein [Pedobacter sp. B4-66]
MRLSFKLAALFFLFSLLSCGKKDTPIKEVPPELETFKALSNFTPTSAKTGTELTITGAGFGSDINKVSIQFADGATIKPKSVANDKMIVIIPTSAISGKIKVSIGNNSSWMTSQQSFTLL